MNTRVFVGWLGASLLLVSLTGCMDLLPYVPGFRPHALPVEDFTGTLELRSWHGRPVYTLRTLRGPVVRLEAAIDLSPFAARTVHLRGSRSSGLIDASVSRLDAQFQRTGTIPNEEYWKVMRVRVISAPKPIDQAPPA